MDDKKATLLVMFYTKKRERYVGEHKSVSKSDFYGCDEGVNSKLVR